LTCRITNAATTPASIVTANCLGCHGFCRKLVIAWRYVTDARSRRRTRKLSTARNATSSRSPRATRALRSAGGCVLAAIRSRIAISRPRWSALPRLPIPDPRPGVVADTPAPAAVITRGS
jgi:hypothetical protein